MPSLPPIESQLAFPPLLKGFRPAGQKSYPGGENTWKKACALIAAANPLTATFAVSR